MEFAGASSAALKKVHLKRLMAVAVALIVCTLAAWEVMIVCWAVTPYMPVRGSGILGDFLSVLVRLPTCCVSTLVRIRCVWAGKRMQLTWNIRREAHTFIAASVLTLFAPGAIQKRAQRNPTTSCYNSNTVSSGSMRRMTCEKDVPTLPCVFAVRPCSISFITQLGESVGAGKG